MATFRAVLEPLPGRLRSLGCLGRFSGGLLGRFLGLGSRFGGRFGRFPCGTPLTAPALLAPFLLPFALLLPLELRFEGLALVRADFVSAAPIAVRIRSISRGDFLDGHHAIDGHQLALLRVIVNQRLGQRHDSWPGAWSALPACRRPAPPRRAPGSRRREFRPDRSSALSLTLSSTTASSFMRFCFRSSSSSSACGTVRGKPSRMKPAAASGWSIRSEMMPTTISSGTRCRRRHDVLGLQPDGRLRRNRGAEHLTGRQLDNTVTLDQPLRLRSLAEPRRSQKYQSHRRKPPGVGERDSAHPCCWFPRPTRRWSDQASVSAGDPAISTS